MSQRVATQFTRVAQFNTTLLEMQRFGMGRARQTGKTNMYLHGLRTLAVIAADIDPLYYNYLWVNPYALHEHLDQAGIPAPRLRGDFLPGLTKKAA